MALTPVRSWSQAEGRLHVVRNAENEVIGVNVTFSPRELRRVLERLNGSGSLNGGWIILEAGRRALVSEGIDEVMW